MSRWVGIDDTPTSGFWSVTNPAGMVQVSELEYDNGGVGDGNLTRSVQIPGGSEADRVTDMYYDWRNRMVARKSGVETSESSDVNRPIVYFTYDNLNRVIVTEQYDGDGVTITDLDANGVPDQPSASLLRARTRTMYDNQGRVYRTEVYSVDPTTGAVASNTLKTDMWYDRRGLLLKTREPGGLITKYRYDGAGRVTRSYLTDGGADTTWSHSGNVTGDRVLEEVQYIRDKNGNVLRETTKQRFHDATGTGALGTATTGVRARVSHRGMYYDRLDRLTAEINVGTNGGTSWTRPSTLPSRSDTRLITTYVYNAAGWLESMTDPRGIVMRREYDAKGRVIKSIEAYTDGIVTNNTNKTVEYGYNGSNQMTRLSVQLPGSGQQETKWLYGVRIGTDSTIDSNDILSAIQHPDETTGASSPSEQELFTVNALGQVVTKEDRNGNVHTYTFDVLGRTVSDAVTTLGSGVDGSVRRLETAYDSQGNAFLFTSYDAASGGNVVNQVQREFNGLGQLTREYQAVDGAINTLTMPFVGYTYSEMAGGANHSRLTGMIYPNGRVVSYNYASGLDNTISRLSSLSDSSGVLEGYEYLGLGTVVIRSHPQPGLDLTYVKQGTEPNGDAGDQYTGLDRFSRIVDQRWINTTTSTDVDRYQYGYDRNSNRLWRDNLLNADFGELYGYDQLNQIVSFARGELNGSKTAIVGTPLRTQEWDHDALGNFDSVTTDGVAENRTHNAQNEVTGVGAATLVFDNMSWFSLIWKTRLVELAGQTSASE